MNWCSITGYRLSRISGSVMRVLVMWVCTPLHAAQAEGRESAAGLPLGAWLLRLWESLPACTECNSPTAVPARPCASAAGHRFVVSHARISKREVVHAALRHPGSWIGFNSVLMVGSLEVPSRARCRAGAWHLPGTTTPQHSVSATTKHQHSVSAARLGRSCRVECQQDHVSHPLARKDVAADDSGVCRGTQQGACMAPRGVRYTGTFAATTPWPHGQCPAALLTYLGMRPPACTRHVSAQVGTHLGGSAP